MSAKMGRFYEFGNFRLDPQEKILFCDEKPLALTPKVFETLEIFVEHAGHLLAKDELIQRLWQDRFVEESNLTFNIKMLRRALQDNPRAPRFIETIPRRGYRFIAEVKENQLPVATKTSGKVTSELELPKELGAPALSGTANRSYLSIAAASVLVVSALFFVAWFGRSRLNAATSSAPILSSPFKSERLPGSGKTHAAITPDGKYVAYTNETQGKQSIWLRQLETSENIQIVPPSETDYLGLAISHDGNSLYFVRRNNKTDANSSAVYRVMTFGGIPVKIVDQTEGWISVSQDDKRLSFVRCNYRDDDYCSLHAIDVDGRNQETLLTRPRPIRIADNQFSPDGRSVAFAAGQSFNGGSDFRLLRFDFANRAETEIIPKKFFYIRSLEWLPGGDGLLVSAMEKLDGQTRIWQVSTTTGETRALTQDATNYCSLSLNKAADKLVATQISNSFHLYFATAKDFNNPSLIIEARTFAFAPDGRIIYSQDDGDIWIVSADGREQRQLTNDLSTDFSPQSSADGRYIFFASNRSGSNQVWRMNSDGSNQVQLTNREGGYPRFISSDGKWIYFESGIHQTLWRASTAGGDESPVVEGKAFAPAISRDGKFIAYVFRASDNHLKFAVRSVADQKLLKTFAVPDRSIAIKTAWSGDNLSFYYITTDDSQNLLWRQTLDDAAPSKIANLGGEDIEDFALSPDGATFAFVRGKWIHDAVLIEGLK